VAPETFAAGPPPEAGGSEVLAAGVRLPFLVKVGYGGGEWANAVVWTFFYALFLYFLTDVVKIGAATAGLVMMAGTLWNAVFQPLVGVWSDRLRSARGRRRPFLILTALPYGVASWLLFTDWGFGDTGTVVYMLVAVLFYFTCLTLFYVPYGALAAELTSDYDERTSLNTYRTLFSQIGALVGAAAPLALSNLLEDLLGSERAGWSAAAAILGVVATLGIVWTWRATAGREQHTQAAGERLRDVFDTLRNRSFRTLLGAYALGWAPLNVIGAVSIYFAVYRMGYSEDYASLVMLTWFLVGVAWLPLVAWMSKRYGKRTTYIVFVLSWAAIQCLFLIPGRGDDVLFWIVLVLSSAGSMAVAVTGWAMIADVTDVDELLSGQRREGLYYGVIAFAQTATAALMVWLAGLVLQWVGYKADVEQTATAMWGIRLLMSVGAAIWLVPGAVFCALMPLTKRRHQAVLKAIEARKAGEPWETDEVRAVL
jgi:GPH family glycoside/pentoside/hexuronide:cation symporter